MAVYFLTSCPNTRMQGARAVRSCRTVLQGVVTLGRAAEPGLRKKEVAPDIGVKKTVALRLNT